MSGWNCQLASGRMQIVAWPLIYQFKVQVLCTYEPEDTAILGRAQVCRTFAANCRASRGLPSSLRTPRDNVRTGQHSYYAIRIFYCIASSAIALTHSLACSLACDTERNYAYRIIVSQTYHSEPRHLELPLRTQKGRIS